MPSLLIITNDGRKENFHINKDEINIGRGKDNDVIFTDNYVSRSHAKIIKTQEGFIISDLGSFNGVQVNSKPIQNYILEDHDLINICNNKLTFFEKNQVDTSISEPFVVISDSDSDKDDQKIVKSSPHGYSDDSGELLVSMEPIKTAGVPDALRPRDDASQKFMIEDLSNLERSNKVLFILYEISKQLNSIVDFNELLTKIMDLIFMVIDADYGFLILIGDKEKEELLPVVVKCKEDSQKCRTELKASKTIVNKVIKDKVALLTSNAMADSRLDHGKSLFIHQIRSAMCVPLWKKDQIIGVIQLDSIRIDNQFDQNDLQLLKTIGSQMALIIEQASLNEQIREEERMRSRLERFHSPQVIEMILEGGQETKDDIMEPKDLTATILFTDIIGFTRLAESMPPREVNMILNQFFSRMTDIIFDHDGTLDKYIGDALMAVFGAPMEKEGDADRAILAALKMREELSNMKKRMELNKHFDIRIGINTGRIVAGNIGSPKRMDYTVIGDPVNIASRLESIAEPNQILIGEETYRHVKDRFSINSVGSRWVKGKTSEILVYEVVGLAT